MTKIEELNSTVIALVSSVDAAVRTLTNLRNSAQAQIDAAVATKTAIIQAAADASIAAAAAANDAQLASMKSQLDAAVAALMAASSASAPAPVPPAVVLPGTVEKI